MRKELRTYFSVSVFRLQNSRPNLLLNSGGRFHGIYLRYGIESKIPPVNLAVFQF